MKTSARPEHSHDPEQLTPEQEATVKAAGAWVNHFARTLKTCRLYDANNPTVVRFRQELAAALTQLLDEHGTMLLTFTADDVLFEGISLYAARSRDDNLAFPFFRDGIRRLIFSPGFEASEIDVLVNSLIQVTGQNVDQDDLVTLLWQAHLPHLEVDYVPGESDIASAEGEQGVPWPTAVGEEEEQEISPAAARQPETAAHAPTSRSDDWNVGEFTTEIEAGFEELQALAPSEIQRFQSEYAAEGQVPVVAAAIALARAYLVAGAEPDDRMEMARFVPRVVRQAFIQGSWREAAESVALLEQCPSADWSIVGFAQELLQPISVSSIKERLEQQDPAAVSDFIAFARGLGEPAVDLLNLVLAEMQNPRHHRLLSDAIVELCRSNPERLAPWLSDRRWFVVKNIVQILGTIGGSQIVGLLKPMTLHPEPRVRLEVLGALRQVELRLARPLLIGLLEGADTRMFCAVLHALSQERDAESAELLLGYLLDADFEKRPTDEKRAIYSALSTVGGDEALPLLEAELHKGNWFSRSQEAHRQAVARCIARIGTPVAREVLERGAKSRRSPIRKACEEVLVRLGKHD